MDYLEEPVGTETMPQLDWVMESDEKNVTQKAYRVQIAADAAFGQLLYDSQKTESRESAHVSVPGAFLESCRRYFVRVKVWADCTGDGCESSWSRPVSFVTGLINHEWAGSFVSAETKADKSNSKGTFLRREFRTEKKIREAYVCSTALGLYNLYLNGQRVGRDQLAPGWTSYRHQLCYQTYDVTDLLVQGENAVGVHLGAGWYKGMMGFIHERNNYGEQTAFLMQLTIRYEDGSVQTVVTDGNWIGCNSPVLFSEIYDGEQYDARLEQDGWNDVGFHAIMNESFRPLTAEEERMLERNILEHPFTEEEKEEQRKTAESYYPSDIGWHPVQEVEFPKDVLTPQPGCRVVIEQEIPAKKMFYTPKGELVLDFGQNLAGWVRFKVRGREGALAHIRCFETLDGEGNAYFANLRAAKAEVKYICRDEREAEYQESFSFQGFRYAKLEEWPCEPALSDFTACVVHSDMEETGSFSCSNPLLNQLEHNIEWSLRGNFLDIPTDCPQRDERMGWTGDAQIFCRTASFLRNTYPFFKKWLRDVAFDQTPEGGVPHIVPNTLAGHVITDWLLGQGTHSAAAWADVAVINPWTLYLTYGDRRILEDQFDSMHRWIEFMRRHARGNIWNYKLQFGDWVALDAEEGSYFGATPNDLTCTAYYAYSTGLFVKICRVLGKEETAQEYEGLYRQIVGTFQKTFFDPDGNMMVQTQTAHIVALYFGLVPQGAEKKTAEGLKRLLEKENGHLVTGFVGTPYFCHALSQNGCTKEAYELLLKEDFPSWLYQVKMGATTIWEHWDGMKPDKTMWSPDMNSFNHYAYGAVGEWLYRVAAGLEIDENDPGYRHIIFSPQTGGNLTWVQGTYESVYGTVSLRWEKAENQSGEACIRLRVQVPVNTAATVLLEEGAEEPDGGAVWNRNQDGRWSIQLGSGTWTFSYRKKEQKNR